MRTITCRTCGKDYYLYGPQIERKIINPGRNACLLFKCKKCGAILNVVRKNQEWMKGPLGNQDIKLEEHVKVEDQ